MENVYLGELKPRAGVSGLHDGRVRNFSRPFVVPVFDPQRTNAEIPAIVITPALPELSACDQLSIAQSFREETPLAPTSSDARARERARPQWHGGDWIHAASRLGSARPRANSFISITLSDLPGFTPYQRLS